MGSCHTLTFCGFASLNPRAKVVLAEAEIPKAISQAFREGNLGIMDYYHLKNIQADTEMRTSISKTSDDAPEM